MSNPERAVRPYDKPLPTISDETRPFWQALRERALRLQRCEDCGHLRYPIAAICPRCLSAVHRWDTLSGAGTIFSYVIFHQVYHPGFRDEVPYNVALIQLDEGPRLFSNIVGVRDHSVGVGDRVEIVYDDVTDAVTLPRFRVPGR